MTRAKRPESSSGTRMVSRTIGDAAAHGNGPVTRTDMDELVGLDVTPAVWFTSEGAHPVFALTLALMNVQLVDGWMAGGSRSDDPDLRVMKELKLTPVVAEKLAAELRRALAPRARSSR